MPQSEVVVSIYQVFNNTGFGRKKDLPKSHFILSHLHEFNKEHSMKLLVRDISNTRDNTYFFLTNLPLPLFSPCITKKNVRGWKVTLMPHNNFHLAAGIKLPSHHRTGETHLPSLESKNSPFMPAWALLHSMEPAAVPTPWEQTAPTHSQTSTSGSQIWKNANSSSSHGNFTAFCLTVLGYLDSPWYQIKQVA